MNLKKLLGMAVIFAAGGLAHSTWGQGQADVTDRYVKNADYSQGKSYWKFTTSGGGWSDPKESSPVVFEAYAGWDKLEMTDFSMNQIVTLPAGNYCLQVNAFYRYGLTYSVDATRSDAFFYVKIGEKEQSNSIKTLGSELVENYANWPSEASSAFNAGLYSNRMDFTVDTEGQVEIGVQGTHALKQSWFMLGPVKLLRYMYTLDDYIKEYTYWYDEAAKLMNDKMDKDVLTTLQTKAVESTTLTTTDACASAIQELRDAVANAKRSSQEYAALNTKIDAAENVDLTDLSSLDANAVSNYKEDLAAVREAYDNGTLTAAAVTKIENPENYMKVKDYNYVTTNYSYAVNLGEWKTVGPTGSKSDQHWSGEARPYLEQSGTAWGQNSWNIKYSQDITLPAGNYIFKVAGRKAEGNGCQLNLTVLNNDSQEELGSVSDFPKGADGLGINKNGVTSFDPNDAAGFANNGIGRGFQWRYVEFALEKETSVNIAVSANATALHQWVSFCDATVQTDNEANISMIAYNIALRDAKATIDDTKYDVITGAERTELQAAIEATSGETAEEINFATQTLNEKAATFVAVLAAYNDIATAKNECDVFVKGELPYASKDKYAAIATAKDLAASKDKANAIRQAYRSYIESNALAEGVENAEVIEIPDANMEVTYDATKRTFGAWEVFNQTGGTINLYDWESFTDASGKSNYKYADISRDDNNTGIRQTIKLVPGKYLLTVTARAAATDGAKFEVFAGDAKASISRIGNTGGAFGKGWNDTSVEFVINEAKDIEIGVKSDNGKNIWWSATRFRLVKIADVEASVDVNIAAGKYATRIFPFVPELPQGVVAYTCDDINENNEVVLTEATTLAANTPYILINTTEEDITDKTLSGVNVATKASYTVGLLTGVYAADGNVPVSTDEEKNYVLQEQNGKQAFYLVDQDGLKFTPYRAYLTVPASTVAGGEVKALFFGDDNATVINGVENTAGATVVGCYNAAGVKLNAPVKGVNILKMSDGSVKKVLVK